MTYWDSLAVRLGCLFFISGVQLLNMIVLSAKGITFVRLNKYITTFRTWFVVAAQGCAAIFFELFPLFLCLE